jgi:cytochrome P450
MPGNVRALFGGRALPVLDGDEHRARKRTIMAAFTHEAIAAYVPRLADLVRAALARWAAEDEIGGVDALRRLAIEAIAGTMMGIEPGPALDALRSDYGRVLRGFKALPIPLPGTTYSRAKAAIGRALRVWSDTIGRHRATPSDDGLSRILAADAASGTAMTTDELARELHHLVLAGLIVWAWCARIIVELEQHPGVRARLLGELGTLKAGTLTLEALEALPYLDQVTKEIRRLAPVVPAAFGKARRTFTFAGHTIPAGWMVLWGTAASHARPEVYPAPERFDPDRFSPGAPAGPASHHYAFAPQGAGDALTGHKCAGYMLAPTLLKVFTVELVRGTTWLLSPGQDLSYDWSEVPPPPRDGLRLRVRTRQPA